MDRRHPCCSRAKCNRNKAKSATTTKQSDVIASQSGYDNGSAKVLYKDRNFREARSDQDLFYDCNTDDENDLPKEGKIKSNVSSKPLTYKPKVKSPAGQSAGQRERKKIRENLEKMAEEMQLLEKGLDAASLESERSRSRSRGRKQQFRMGKPKIFIKPENLSIPLTLQLQVEYQQPGSAVSTSGQSGLSIPMQTEPYQQQLKVKAAVSSVQSQSSKRVCKCASKIKSGALPTERNEYSSDATQSTAKTMPSRSSKSNANELTQMETENVPSASSQPPLNDEANTHQAQSDTRSNREICSHPTCSNRDYTNLDPIISQQQQQQQQTPPQQQSQSTINNMIVPLAPTCSLPTQTRSQPQLCTAPTPLNLSETVAFRNDCCIQNSFTATIPSGHQPFQQSHQVSHQTVISMQMANIQSYTSATMNSQKESNPHLRQTQSATRMFISEEHSPTSSYQASVQSAGQTSVIYNEVPLVRTYRNNNEIICPSHCHQFAANNQQVEQYSPTDFYYSVDDEAATSSRQAASCKATFSSGIPTIKSKETRPKPRFPLTLGSSLTSTQYHTIPQEMPMKQKEPNEKCHAGFGTTSRNAKPGNRIGKQNQQRVNRYQGDDYYSMESESDSEAPAAKKICKPLRLGARGKSASCICKENKSSKSSKSTKSSKSQPSFEVMEKMCASNKKAAPKVNDARDKCLHDLLLEMLRLIDEPLPQSNTQCICSAAPTEIMDETSMPDTDKSSMPTGLYEMDEMSYIQPSNVNEPLNKQPMHAKILDVENEEECDEKACEEFAKNMNEESESMAANIELPQVTCNGNQFEVSFLQCNGNQGPPNVQTITIPLDGLNLPCNIFISPNVVIPTNLPVSMTEQQDHDQDQEQDQEQNQEEEEQQQLSQYSGIGNEIDQISQPIMEEQEEEGHPIPILEAIIETEHSLENVLADELACSEYEFEEHYQQRTANGKPYTHDEDCMCNECAWKNKIMGPPPGESADAPTNTFEMKFFIDSLILDLDAMEFARRQKSLQCGLMPQRPPAARESFPVTIVEATDLGTTSLFIKWIIHDCTGIGGYEIFVDGYLTNRYFHSNHEAAVICDVDVNQPHKIVLLALPQLDDMNSILSDNCGDKQSSLMRKIDAQSLTMKTAFWAPSIYFYDPSSVSSGCGKPIIKLM